MIAGPAVGAATLERPTEGAAEHSRYKWIALFTTTLGSLMVFINQSIVLIALPDGAVASFLRGGKYHHAEPGEKPGGGAPLVVPSQEAVAETEHFLVD